MTDVPDFGFTRLEWCGLVLETRAIAPNLSLQDLVQVYEAASKEGNPAAGNPSEWPVSKGVRAVVDAVLTAVYGSDQAPSVKSE